MNFLAERESVKIVLISNDTTLLSLCQDVASNLPGDKREVLMVGPTQSVDADLYLYDLDCKPAIVWQEERMGLDLFLVRKTGLKSFIDKYPQARPHTLLKPVSPVALEAFLTHAPAVPFPGGYCSPPLDGNTTGATASGALASKEAVLQSLLFANLKLQEFEEERTNFWARAAHDLRAPLTAAGGYCGLLLEERLGPLNADQHELLRRIGHGIRKLNRMASAMFQLTAGRQIERKLQLERVDIETCIRHSVDEVSLYAGERELTIDLSLVGARQAIYLEPNQIEQVLVNLLENACRFAPRKSVIEVRGYPVAWPFSRNADSFPGGVPANPATANGYRVDVRDTGPGIPPERLAMIFTEYVSYGGSKDRSGGGLGLAICKRILQAHQGEIWAEVSNPGTMFSFVVPNTQSLVQGPLSHMGGTKQ